MGEYELPSGKNLPVVVFFGDSLIEWGSWSRAFPDVRTINLGVCGDTTAGMLYRCRDALRHDPKKIFIIAGANDLSCGLPVQDIVANYDGILRTFREGAPDCTVYVQSVLPSHHRAWGLVLGDVYALNEQLPDLAEDNGCLYLDIHPEFTDEDGHMRAELTDDGVHLSEAGYRLWERVIRPHVTG